MKVAFFLKKNLLCPKMSVNLPRQIMYNKQCKIHMEEFRELYFTHIHEIARHNLGITRDEYALANYIDTWSNYPLNPFRGWCNQTLNQKAQFVGVTTRGLTKMQNKLIQLGLVEKDSLTSRTRTTLRWFDTVTAAKSAEQSSVPWKLNREQSSASEGTKFPINREQSSAFRLNSGNKVPTHIESILSVDNKEYIISKNGNPETIIEAVMVTDIELVVEALNKFLKPARPFSSKTKATQSFVNARIKEKYTVADICLVIEYKTAEWFGTDFEQYLRPSTLFGTGKFEGYLVNASNWVANGKPKILKNGKNGKYDRNNSTAAAPEFTSGAFV